MFDKGRTFKVGLDHSGMVRERKNRKRHGKKLNWMNIGKQQCVCMFLTLEIPDFGTLFRVPMSTVEYQIGHDQKIIFLPLEPQKV